MDIVFCVLRPFKVGNILNTSKTQIQTELMRPFFKFTHKMACLAWVNILGNNYQGIC